MKSRVIFILDKSGSMRSILDDTLGGFNTYVETLQEADEAGDISMSLVQFDSSAISTTYKDKPIKEVPALDKSAFIPGDMTPLIEASVKTIEAAAQSDASDLKTIVVIMTDGQENSSKREYTNERLAELIAEKRKLGWEFVFLGAGIDAYGQAGKMGIGAGQTMSYDSSDRGATLSTYSSVAHASLRSMRGAGAMSFSAEDKASAGDKFAPPPVQPQQPQPAAKRDRLSVDL